jgi:two-component system C4-dicarboxylate transport sensor histidine kinase DctB
MLQFMEPSLASAGVGAAVMAREGPVMVNTDADLVEQVLLNLLKNAIEALPPGGTVTLATGHDASGVFIDIVDDGPGLAPDVQSHLFQPFVTSKGTEGSGLGLAVSRRLARTLGGDLLLRPTATGTAWRLTLPLLESA